VSTAAELGINRLNQTGARTINTPQRAKAAAIVAQFEQDVPKIHANTNLTPLARQQAVAVKWKRAKTDLSALQDEEAAHLAARHDALERSLFGQYQIGADHAHAMAVRDAQARAAQIASPAEADAAMTRAGRDGDHMLVRAIAGHAYDQGWSDTVLNTYPSIRPEVGAQVHEIADLDDHLAGSSSAQAAVGKALTFGLSTPTGYSENQLEGLAAAAKPGGTAA
jgi:hypothetical protein